MSKRWKTVLIWAALLVLFFAIYQLLGQHRDGESDVSISSLLVTFGPLVLIVALFIVFMRKFGGGAQGFLTMRKTTARVAAVPTTTFASVGGASEAKDRLLEVVDFIKHPRRWEASGARLPTGVLLEGAPGTGKTLLARAVAGEAKIPFFEVSASEFVELFVGVGAARVRDLFEEAAKKAPAIVFIDEIDAVGRRRGANSASMGHQEREQTLNQLLVSLDGFQKAKRVVVIAATNRADILDEALLRPGRFDVRLKLPPLSAEGRTEILAIHTKGKPLASTVDLAALGRETDGFSGAELEHLANEAVLVALRRTPESGAAVVVEPADFAAALKKRRSGDPRFDRLDAALIESVSQIAQPTKRVTLRATLDGGDTTEGDLVWVDSHFLKLRVRGGASVVIAKHRVLTLQALNDTASAAEDLAHDRWALATPDVA